jgi:hypothetical protein
VIVVMFMMMVGDGDEDACNDHGDDGCKYSNDGNDGDVKRIAEMVMIPMVVVCNVNSDSNCGGNDHGDSVVVMVW